MIENIENLPVVFDFNNFALEVIKLELKNMDDFIKNEFEHNLKRETKVKLISSRFIELTRYPDFRGDAVGEKLSDIFEDYTHFAESDQRTVIFFLLDYMNHQHKELYDLVNDEGT